MPKISLPHSSELIGTSSRPSTLHWPSPFNRTKRTSSIILVLKYSARMSNSEEFLDAVPSYVSVMELIASLILLYRSKASLDLPLALLLQDTPPLLKYSLVITSSPLLTRSSMKLLSIVIDREVSFTAVHLL